MEISEKFGKSFRGLGGISRNLKIGSFVAFQEKLIATRKDL